MSGSGPPASESAPVLAVEQSPAVAIAIFGSQLPLAMAFADLLVSDGVERGIIGPHEPGRIWSRHLLNCAVVADVFEVGARVVDIGSGAGLPGLALAIRRADLRVDLVEPMQRRVDFLRETVAALGLESQVRVIRGRAEDREVVNTVGRAEWVTARAVAPLDRLVRWCLPLLSSGGQLALVKGATAVDELEQHRAALARLGARELRITLCGAGQLDPPVQLVTLTTDTRTARKGAR